jgi:hypothetical protein
MVFVAIGWFLLCVLVTLRVSSYRSLSRRKYHHEDENENGIVLPYPVTSDRGHAQLLDLSHEPEPYLYGLVGRPTSAAIRYGIANACLV